ncbi:GH36-type glycosyl hydrolase domain-containing protein [Georgenia sp.]
MTGPAVGPPWVLVADGGLRAVVIDGGAPVSLGTDRLELVQHAASAFEAGLLQLWVRDRASGGCWPVLGAGSGSRAGLEGGRLVMSGGAVDHHDGLTWQATLTLVGDRPAWAWHVEVVNEGPAPRDVDLVHGHDVALAAPDALRTNELYVSQYLDVTPLHGDGFGTALAVRQNLPQAGLHPWCVLAATSPVVAWATDAIDVHGLAARAARPAPGLAGDLPSRRRQHEHTMVTLQTGRVLLGPGERIRTSFAGLLVDDHPAATSDADLPRVAEALASARGAAPWSPAGSPPVRPPVAGPRGVAPAGAYERGRELAVRPLTEDELRTRWPVPWRAVERDDGGGLRSFFTADDAHVVPMAKELAVLRPHGTILRTGDRASPDPASLTTTAWMTGSPLSYLTLGHASSDPVLTTVRGYLGLHRAYGVRVFIEVRGAWRLLDLPSAFAMTPDSARWVYAAAGGSEPAGVVEVSTVAPPQDHRIDLRVRLSRGAPRRLMLALHLATDADPLPAADAARAERTADGIVVRSLRPGHDDGPTLFLRTANPVTVGDDGLLFDDGRSRSATVVTLVTTTTSEFAVELRLASGNEDDDAPSDESRRRAQRAPQAPGAGAAWWPDVTALRVADGPDADLLAVSLPWLVRDALVHFLAPRGLEQYTGGAWGTRDVSQGPLELLLALDRRQDARDLLLTIFAAQEPDGAWPQAFGFLPGHEDFRMGPPHGDVLHWPVLAVGRYLQASGDASLLEEPVDWYTPAGEPPEPASTVLTHLERALDLARAGVLPGTRLGAYGHGDWHDSLQPADPAMARTLTSAWTVTLHHQALATLADGLGVVGGHRDLVAVLLAEAAEVAADLHRYLVVDGELAGYAQLDPPDVRGEVAVRRLLVHPRDTETGLSHGSLQMIHALGSGLFDPTQAAHHVALVREHLLGVDGVRLFDRPPAYHGGPMRHFQRAETATFVGREIGLMYVHAHLRWCEAMAHWGDAEALWLGIAQVLPPATVQVVPGARPRQANTYASSSDAVVLDRADFARRYADVLTGQTTFEGGWRIYSSGPGVLVRVLTQSLLGIRRRGSTVLIDPVLPARLDGLTVEVPLGGGLLRVRYRVGPRGHGPTDVHLAGQAMTATRIENPYRPGGLAVDLADLTEALRPGGPELEVRLS